MQLKNDPCKDSGGLDHFKSRCVEKKFLRRSEGLKGKINGEERRGEDRSEEERAEEISYESERVN